MSRVEPHTKKHTKGGGSFYKGKDGIRSIEQNGDYRFENIKEQMTKEAYI